MNDLEIRRMRPQLLFVVVAREGGKAAAKLLQDCHIPFHYQTLAEGTASSDTLDVMGLAEADKLLLLGIAPSNLSELVMSRIGKSPRLSATGMCIAFSVPLTGITSPVMRLMDAETRERMMKKMEQEIEKKAVEARYNLVMIIAEPGYSDDIVRTAREAGAGGGTIVHARRAGMEETMKVWGLSIQEEKELILIAVRREDKAPVMRAITEKYGVSTAARAVAVSMPVDSAIGLDPDADE